MANTIHQIAHHPSAWKRACVAVFAVAGATGSGIAQVTSQLPLAGAWLVTVQGDARPRILTVATAPQTDELAITLNASYGWFDGNQAPIKATLRKSERPKLEIVTDADSVISADQGSDGNFVGKFQPRSGTVRGVKLERLSEDSLLKLRSGLLKASQPCLARALGTENLQASPSSQAVQAPNLQTGDCWSYLVRDMYTGSELYRSEVVAAASGSEGNYFYVKKNDRVARSVQTSELNTLQKFGDKESDSGDLRFPITVGKKWKSLTYYKEADGTVGKLEFDREVLGFEKVKVPAGEFDAFKIVAHGNWSIIENPKGWNDTFGRADRTYWYAPSAKRIVMFEYRQYARGHNPPWEREELTGLNVQ